MPTPPPHRRSRLRRLWRVIERALLGAVMSVIAFVIERRVLKAIREGALGTSAEQAPKGHTGVETVPVPDDEG